MTSLVRPELRNEETIRAYLEELVRLKTPVQFWLPLPGALPFETTLEQVGKDTISLTTTPLLETGQVLNVAFMLDARRFTSQTQVVATGVFRLPLSVGLGERRAHPRGPFDRHDRAEVLAVERCAGTVLGGRTLQGRLLDLSACGLRLALDEFDVLNGPVRVLAPGDRFDLIQLTELPHTPPIRARGQVAHLTGTTAGLTLEGLQDADQMNLERILAPRFPPTFGHDFPARKRRTELADRPGAPTPKQVKARPPEVVERPLEVPPPEPERPVRPPVTPVLRLRKAARRILLLSAQGSTQALSAAFREDGFKHVFEARSFVETQDLAGRMRFDLLLLDNTMSGHWGKDMMKALHAHRLLLDTPIILVVECRNEFSVAIAEALDAVHIHERREPFEALLPVLHRLLLD